MKQSEIKKLVRQMHDYHDTRIEMMNDQRTHGVAILETDMVWEKSARHTLWTLIKALEK